MNLPTKHRPLASRAMAWVLPALVAFAAGLATGRVAVEPTQGATAAAQPAGPARATPPIAAAELHPAVARSDDPMAGY